MELRQFDFLGRRRDGPPMMIGGKAEETWHTQIQRCWLLASSAGRLSIWLRSCAASAVQVDWVETPEAGVNVAW